MLSPLIMLPPFLRETMGPLGSSIAAFMVAYTVFQNYLPYELQTLIRSCVQKLKSLFHPYIQIKIHQYEGEGFERSVAFSQVERYLNANATEQAKRLEANALRDSSNITIVMDQEEKVTGVYQGMKLEWISKISPPNGQTISWYPREENKYFVLTFHKRYRGVIINNYLKHVFDEGKMIQARERRRMLYTNHATKGNDEDSKVWTHVAFRHPASFDTLAMDPAKKKEIMDDLINFSKAKDYYAKIGKAWKRGYLLHGPPGTGKSTMIAAMANLLNYDVYDLELTAVKDNTELRKLLIDTKSKAIIVIEDIDCSLDLTGQRVNKKGEKSESKDSESDDSTGREKKKVERKIKECTGEKEKDKSKQVTLSGLLNFIDGLWSSCGEERIIVFTTNYVDKLDPALIRAGRMDKHIELSYCGFEAFKCLAKNYLDVESHELFARIEELLDEIKMSPADVAEKLMPKSFGEDKESCLIRLVKALDDLKVEKMKKSKQAVTALPKRTGARDISNRRLTKTQGQRKP